MAAKKAKNKPAAKKNLPSVFDFNRVLVVEKVSAIDSRIHALVKNFLKEKKPGMLISFSKPYSTIKEHLQKEKIDISKLFVVDAVSEVPEKKRESNALFTGGLGELTDISIAISQFIESVEGEKFIVTGALNLLLIHNDLRTVSKFVIAVTSKIAGKKTSAVFFISDKEKGLLETVYPFFDKVIEGGKTG